jgi:hypothetical protein
LESYDRDVKLKQKAPPEQADLRPDSHKGVLSDTPIVGLDGALYPDPICDNDDLWSCHMVIIHK